MMTNRDVTIRVEARVLGQRRSLHDPWHVILPEEFFQRSPGSSEAEPQLRLRDLIDYVVRAEVRGFQQRQEKRRLAQVLSPQEIIESTEGGKVLSGSMSKLYLSRGDSSDEESAVAQALQAFEDGLYFVFLDGRQQPQLDYPIQYTSTSVMTFLRLVPLIGG